MCNYIPLLKKINDCTLCLPRARAGMTARDPTILQRLHFQNPKNMNGYVSLSALLLLKQNPPFFLDNQWLLMGCFFACFGTSKHRKSKKSSNPILSGVQVSLFLKLLSCT